MIGSSYPTTIVDTIHKKHNDERQGTMAHIPNKFGNYQIIREIGRGGFATVYLAKHIYLMHYAAIKVLVSAETELFRQEAQTLMDLQHPNIIRVLDFGIEEQTPYLIMNYAPYGQAGRYG
jgi:serine/threonine protein kinase